MLESIVNSESTELRVSIDCLRASAVRRPLLEPEATDAIECLLSRSGRSKSAHAPFEKPVANEFATLLSDAIDVRHDERWLSPAPEKFEKPENAIDDVRDDDV